MSCTNIFFHGCFNIIKSAVVVLLMCSTLFTGCATILTPRYQKVEIENPKGGEILVDGEEPNMKKGQYALKRDKEAKHIVLKKDGYKEVHKSVMQYKYSPWRIMTYIPFGVLFYPLFFDVGEKAFNYPNDIKFDKQLQKIPQKTVQDKNIRLNNISANIEASEMQYQFYSTYKRFIKDRSAYKSKGTEKIEP